MYTIKEAEEYIRECLERKVISKAEMAMVLGVNPDEMESKFDYSSFILEEDYEDDCTHNPYIKEIVDACQDDIGLAEDIVRIIRRIKNK